MAKVLQRLPSHYEEHQAGCIRGLLNIFDFRHGRSTRGLLAQVARTKDSSTNLAETCDNIVDTEENKIPLADVSKTRVQEIMQEDAFNGHNHLVCSAVDLEKTDPKYRNNQLLLKLVQDQSSLLVDHITNGDQTCDPRLGSSEAKPADFKSGKSSRRTRRHSNLFHLRSKSLNNDSPSSSKIVVLNPLAAEVQNPERDDDIHVISLQTECKKEQFERQAPQFSLHVIKKKLRQAMGKQSHGIFSNRNHIYMGKQNDGGLTVVTETCQYVHLEGSNIYIEAKRHLSELLNHVDEKAEPMEKQMSISLGRILAFPEYSNPGKRSDGILESSVNLKGDTFCHGNRDHQNSRKPDDTVESLHMDASIPLDKIQPFTEDCKISQEPNSSSIAVGIEEETGITPEEEQNITTNNSSESPSDLINDESLSQCLDDSSTVSFTASPILSPVSRKLEESEHAIDITDWSSPVSVLDPLFTDNNISPSSCTSQPVEDDIQHIQSEAASSVSNQGNYATVPLDDNEEPSFEYIEAVMLASGLNRDDILLRWISFCDILDPSSFDQVEILSAQPQHDQRLLFDCTNEALQELCENSFRSLAGISHVKHMFQGVPEAWPDLIHEVWERVESRLFQNPEFELDSTGKWMNLDLEFELMCSEMEKAIFDELVQDTLFTYIC